MLNPPISTLVDPVAWYEQALPLMAGYGFLVLRGDRAGAQQQSLLLVVLRDQPTLHHFDPEGIDYWVTDQGRGRRARLDRQTTVGDRATHAWGTIQLTDRLGVRNEFLTFGGSVRTRVTADGSLLVEFVSPAPILRLAGHSQGFDPLSPDVGSFFGRLKIPIDFVPGAETRIASMPPRVLYTAFVQDLRARYGGSEALRDAHADVAAWARRESSRLEADAPDDWQAALNLRRELGIA